MEKNVLKKFFLKYICNIELFENIREKEKKGFVFK